MLVKRIGFNNSVLPFSGNSRKKDVNKDKIIVIQPSASDKAANRAIKTLLISALMTSPAVINTSCDKWTEEDFSHWENENPAHYKDYVYIIPSRKVDGIMLPTDDAYPTELLNTWIFLEKFSFSKFGSTAIFKFFNFS